MGEDLSINNFYHVCFMTISPEMRESPVVAFKPHVNDPN